MVQIWFNSDSHGYNLPSQFLSPPVQLAQWASYASLTVCSLSVCLDLTEMGENK